MLKIERLTKYIDGKLIFKDISCAINDQHLLISESGCGKSTLAKIIAGLDMNYQGDLYFNGQLRKSYTAKEWMKHIQYVPQYQRDTLNQRKTVLSTLLEPLKNYKFDKQSYTSRIEAVLRMQVTTKHTQSKHFDAKWWAISTCMDSEGTNSRTRDIDIR